MFLFANQGSSSVRARSRSLAPPGAGSSEITEQGSSSDIFFVSGSGSGATGSSTDGSSQGVSETLSSFSCAFFSFSERTRSSCAERILSLFCSS